jgi:hypothetical protein
MSERSALPTGGAAPRTGTYEQIDALGQPTGIRVNLDHERSFPPAPIGHFWRPVEVLAGDDAASLVEHARKTPPP